MKRLDAQGAEGCKISLEVETPTAPGLPRVETGDTITLLIIADAAYKLVSTLGVACTCGAEPAEPLLHATDCHVYLKDLIVRKSQRVAQISSLSQSPKNTSVSRP